jgi:hypothetical protein
MAKTTEPTGDAEFAGLTDVKDVALNTCKASNVDDHTTPTASEQSSGGRRGWLKAAAIISAAIVVVTVGGVTAAVVLKSNTPPRDSVSGSAFSVTGPGSTGLNTHVESFEYSAGRGCLDATLYSKFAPSANACEQKCALLSRCASFVFTASKNTCRLFKSPCKDDVAALDFKMGTPDLFMARFINKRGHHL